MVCQSCGVELEESAFPGAQVRCGGCGSTQRVPDYVPVTDRAQSSPYRRAAPMEPEPELAPDSELDPSSIDLRGGPCPRCAGVRLEARFDDFSCPRCGGLFVTHERLQQLVDDHRAAGLRPVLPSETRSAENAAAVTYLPCPSCSARMNRKNFGDRSGIVVDVCKLHGVWLDHGELDGVIAYAYDLPEDAGARAALLALVKRELPPPSKQMALPYELPDHASRRRQLDRELVDSVEQLTNWIASLFR